MCTVTVIPLAGNGRRLVSNRDEVRTRPPSSLPRDHAIAGGHALWPVDPTGGGTWIAVSDQGVAKLADFGASKQLGPEGTWMQTGSLKGEATGPAARAEARP